MEQDKEGGRQRQSLGCYVTRSVVPSAYIAWCFPWAVMHVAKDSRDATVTVVIVEKFASLQQALSTSARH